VREGTGKAVKLRPGSVLYVVPTLGRRPDYLAETLDSLMSQDADVTVVLVAPRDAGAAFEAAQERGLTVLPEPAPGLSAAINEGFRRAGAEHEFWAWLGDDDTLVPGSTRGAVVELRRHPRSSMVYGRCDYVDENGRPMYEVRPSRLAATLLRWGPNLVPQPGSVARADAVRRAGLLDESLRYAMDLDLFLRLADVGRLRYLPRTLARFRWHAGSTTVASAAASEAEARAVRARTWTGRRSIGPAVSPVAQLAGRLLHRAQLRRPRSP
jgi:GT2 family glycosyltransferase